MIQVRITINKSVTYRLIYNDDRYLLNDLYVLQNIFRALNITGFEYEYETISKSNGYDYSDVVCEENPLSIKYVVVQSRSKLMISNLSLKTKRNLEESNDVYNVEYIQHYKGYEGSLKCHLTLSDATIVSNNFKKLFQELKLISSLNLDRDTFTNYAIELARSL